MNDAQRRRIEKLEREKVFMTDNAADFPKDSPGDKINQALYPKMAAALGLDAELTAELGERRAAQDAKDDARDALLDRLRDMATGAIGIGSEIPGGTAIFRLPDNRSDQNLIAAATAFHEAATPHEAKFVEVGLDADFLARLVECRDELAQNRDAWKSAVGEHAAAVGALDALFREMMTLSRKRDAVVKIKYKNNPGKLAAWAVASHLDRAPRRKPETTPAPIA